MEFPVFDKPAALERVDNDVELLVELVDMCKGQAAAKLPAMKTLVEQGNSLELGAIAHSLKSAFGNVGAMRVHDLTFQIEKAGKEFHLQEVPKLLEDLQSELDAFFKEFAGEKLQ